MRVSSCVSWPQLDASMVSLIKGLLQHACCSDLSDEKVLKFGRSKDKVFHFELFI